MDFSAHLKKDRKLQGRKTKGRKYGDQKELGRKYHENRPKRKTIENSAKSGTVKLNLPCLVL